MSINCLLIISLSKYLLSFVYPYTHFYHWSISVYIYLSMSSSIYPPTLSMYLCMYWLYLYHVSSHWFIYLSTHPVYISIYLSGLIYVSIYLSNLYHLSINHVPSHLFIYLPIMYLVIYSFIYQSINHVFSHLFIYLSTHPIYIRSNLCIYVSV